MNEEQKKELEDKWNAVFRPALMIKDHKEDGYSCAFCGIRANAIFDYWFEEVNTAFLAGQKQERERTLKLLGSVEVWNDREDIYKLLSAEPKS